MVTCLHCFGACLEADRHGRKHMVEQSYPSHGGQEVEGEREVASILTHAYGMPLINSFFHLDSPKHTHTHTPPENSNG